MLNQIRYFKALHQLNPDYIYCTTFNKNGFTTIINDRSVEYVNGWWILHEPLSNLVPIHLDGHTSSMSRKLSNLI